MSGKEAISLERKKNDKSRRGGTRWRNSVDNKISEGSPLEEKRMREPPRLIDIRKEGVAPEARMGQPRKIDACTSTQ